MWTLNLGKPVNVPKLTEASAIELGAELVGEAVIFTIASTILMAEFVRQSRKEAVKEAEREAQMEQIQADLKELYMQNVHQEAYIRELVHVLAVKVPDFKFCPEPFSQAAIPEHHRDHLESQEESKSAYSTVKGWVFNAIDFVLPPDDTTVENQPKIIIVQQKPSSSSDCKCEDVSGQNNSNNISIENKRR